MYVFRILEESGVRFQGGPAWLADQGVEGVELVGTVFGGDPALHPTF